MHDIGTTTLYKLPINYKYMCVCLIWVSKCFGMVCCLFFKYNKTLQHGFIPYITFYLRCKCSTLWGARTHHNAMKRSMVNCLLYVRKTGYLLIVSSFKLLHVHRYTSDILTFRGAFVLLFWLYWPVFFLLYMFALTFWTSSQDSLNWLPSSRWNEGIQFKEPQETQFSSQI